MSVVILSVEVCKTYPVQLKICLALSLAANLLCFPSFPCLPVVYCKKEKTLRPCKKKKKKQTREKVISSKDLRLPAVCEAWCEMIMSVTESGISGLSLSFLFFCRCSRQFPRLPASQMCAAAVCNHVCPSAH